MCSVLCAVCSFFMATLQVLLTLPLLQLQNESMQFQPPLRATKLCATKQPQSLPQLQLLRCCDRWVCLLHVGSWKSQAAVWGGEAVTDKILRQLEQMRQAQQELSRKIGGMMFRPQMSHMHPIE